MVRGWQCRLGWGQRRLGVHDSKGQLKIEIIHVSIELPIYLDDYPVTLDNAEK
jgi:hypothetical protein